MRNIPLSLGCLILSSTCLAQQPNWVQVKTKNSPPVRRVHGMAYDFVRGRTVLFGGQSGNANVRNDTWEYDGKNWVEIKPKTVPPARHYSSMVFHFARLRTVLFGGRNSSGAFLNDTWTWDGNNWTQIKPATSPPSRYMHAMAYDSRRQRTVLFGGIRTAGTLGDTWEWDGSNWTQIMTTNSPSARFGHGMAYDSSRKRLVLFGGTGTAHLNDTWEYDGKNWIRMAPTTRPTIRSWHGMAYDTARMRTVVFGGYFAQSGTWEYDGKNWTRMRPRTEPGDHGFRWGNELMVYDGRRKRMVLFGGITVSQKYPNDTWEYVPSQFLAADPSTISIATGGTQRFFLDADTPNASRLYWIFGSVTGTSPGVRLSSATGSVKIPLNPDFWTDITIEFANRRFLANTKSKFDTSGKALAWFNVPKITNSSAIGVKFHHAYLVYDAQNNFYMASNPVELMLVK